MLITRYCQDEQIEDDIGWTRGAHGKYEKCIRFGRGNPEGKRLLGGPKHRWKDYIKIDAARCRLDSTSLGQGPVRGCCEHSNESTRYLKRREFLD